MISKRVVALSTAAICGTLIMGYCIYTDMKRKRSPVCKVNRKRAIVLQRNGVQNFYLQEISYGKECLINGDIDNGVQHLANAVAVCRQPYDALRALQPRLPADIFSSLVVRLQGMGQQLTVHEPCCLALEEKLKINAICN